MNKSLIKKLEKMLDSYEKSQTAAQAIKILWKGENDQLIDPDTGEVFIESEHNKPLLRVILQRY